MRRRKASSRGQENLVVFRYECTEDEKIGRILTGCWERIVVGTQAQEKKQRCEPDADPKEGCHVSEGGHFHHEPATICLAPYLTRLVRGMCEMEEPHEMVDDDKDA